MRKLSIHIALLILTLFTRFDMAFSQKQLNEGNKYYDRNMFEEAIPYYLKEIDAGKNTKYKNEAKEKLANCYRLTGRFLEAADIYKIILDKSSKNNKAENYLNYANSLKNAAKYEEAAENFKKYIALAPDDPMGRVYLESCIMAQKWLDEEEKYYVKNVESVNTDESEYSPDFYKDGISFSSARPDSKKKFINISDNINVNRSDLYYIDFKDSKNGNAPIENISGLNSYQHDGSASFSQDGKKVFFSRTITGAKNKKTNSVLNSLQIFYSEKDSLGNWKTPVSAFSFNSDKYSVAQPSLSKDGKRVYFASDMPGGAGNTDIYYSELLYNGQWSDPVNVGPIVNTFGHELFPYIQSKDTLYFSSETHQGMGKLDIFRAVYKDGKWGDITNMGSPINSIGDDFGIVLDPTQTRGFFSSDRFNGKGKEDIYTLYKYGPQNVYLNGNNLQFPDLTLFNGITYKTTNEATNETVTLESKDGFYSFPLQEGVGYTVNLRKDGFFFDALKLRLYRNEGDTCLLARIQAKNSSYMVGGALLTTDIKISQERVPNPENTVAKGNQNPIAESLLANDTTIIENPIKGVSVSLWNSRKSIRQSVSNDKGFFSFSDTLLNGKEYILYAAKLPEPGKKPEEFEKDKPNPNYQANKEKADSLKLQEKQITPEKNENPEYAGKKDSAVNIQLATNNYSVKPKDEGQVATSIENTKAEAKTTQVTTGNNQITDLQSTRAYDTEVANPTNPGQTVQAVKQNNTNQEAKVDSSGTRERPNLNTQLASAETGNSTKPDKNSNSAIGSNQAGNGLSTSTQSDNSSKSMDKSIPANVTGTNNNGFVTGNPVAGNTGSNPKSNNQTTPTASQNGLNQKAKTSSGLAAIDQESSPEANNAGIQAKSTSPVTVNNQNTSGQPNNTVTNDNVNLQANTGSNQIQTTQTSPLVTPIVSNPGVSSDAKTTTPVGSTASKPANGVTTPVNNVSSNGQSSNIVTNSNDNPVASNGIKQNTTSITDPQKKQVISNNDVKSNPDVAGNNQPTSQEGNNTGKPVNSVSQVTGINESPTIHPAVNGTNSNVSPSGNSMSKQNTTYQAATPMTQKGTNPEVKSSTAGTESTQNANDVATIPENNGYLKAENTKATDGTIDNQAVAGTPVFTGTATNTIPTVIDQHIDGTHTRSISVQSNTSVTQNNTNQNSSKGLNNESTLDGPFDGGTNNSEVNNQSNTTYQTKDPSSIKNQSSENGNTVNHETYTFSGKIVDSLRNKVLSDCMVKVYEGDQFIEKTRTDAQGKITIDIPVGHDYEIYVMKEGFFQSGITVSGSKDLKTNGANVTLKMKPIEKNKSIELKNILFDFNKYSLRKESLHTLDQLSDFMVINPTVTIELNAHTDTRGEYYTNLLISYKRAEATREYLLSKGIDDSRIFANGFGETFPLIKNASTESEHEKNRRVEFRVIDNNGQSSSQTGFSVLSSNPYSEENPYPSSPPLPDGVIYRIKLGTFSKVVPFDTFKGVFPVVQEWDQNNHVYNYFAGIFSSQEAADNALKIVKARVSDDVYIQPYLENKPITFAELKKEMGTVGQGINAIETTESDRVNGIPSFSIQVGAFRHPVKSSTKSEFARFAGQYGLMINEYNGNIIYSIGDFKDYANAYTAKQKLMDEGLTNESFIIALINGKRIQVSEALEIISRTESAIKNSSTQNIN